MGLFGLIPWIARLLLSRKPSLAPAHAMRLAKIIGWGIAIIAAVLIAVLAWSIIEGNIREDERKTIRAERVEDALEGMERASEGDRARREAADRDSDAAQDDLDAIHTEDPDSQTRPASRGSRRVADRLPTEN